MSSTTEASPWRLEWTEELSARILEIDAGHQHSKNDETEYDWIEEVTMGLDLHVQPVQSKTREEVS